MNLPTRRTLIQFTALMVLIGLCLVFRRAFYFFERTALELRYFWWLFLILALGLWFLSMIGPNRK